MLINVGPSPPPIKSLATALGTVYCIHIFILYSAHGTHLLAKSKAH